MNRTQKQSAQSRRRVAGAVTEEQVRMGREHMIGAFLSVMASGNTDSLYWTGTQTDLIEIVYSIYNMHIMHHDDGTPCQFAWLVRRACAVLHMPEPVNPSVVAAKALRRKGVKQMTMAERYAWQKYVAGVDNPLRMEITDMRAQ